MHIHDPVLNGAPISRRIALRSLFTFGSVLIVTQKVFGQQPNCQPCRGQPVAQPAPCSPQQQAVKLDECLQPPTIVVCDTKSVPTIEEFLASAEKLRVTKTDINGNPIGFPTIPQGRSHAENVQKLNAILGTNDTDLRKVLGSIAALKVMPTFTNAKATTSVNRLDTLIVGSKDTLLTALDVDLVLDEAVIDMGRQYYQMAILDKKMAEGTAFLNHSLAGMENHVKMVECFCIAAKQIVDKYECLKTRQEMVYCLMLQLEARLRALPCMIAAAKRRAFFRGLILGVFIGMGLGLAIGGVGGVGAIASVPL